MQHAGDKFATEEDEKLYMNRMRSKVNRMCCRTSTGKLQVSEDLHKIWAQAGSARDGLVKIMADCDGRKDNDDAVLEIVLTLESRTNTDPIWCRTSSFGTLSSTRTASTSGSKPPRAVSTREKI